MLRSLLPVTLTHWWLGWVSSPVEKTTNQGKWTNQADWHALGVGILVDNLVQLNWGAGCDNMTSQADWHTLGVEILVDRQVRLKLDSRSNWHTNRHKPKLRTNKQINSQWVHFGCYRFLYPYPMANWAGLSSPDMEDDQSGKRHGKPAPS